MIGYNPAQIRTDLPRKDTRVAFVLRCNLGLLPYTATYIRREYMFHYSGDHLGAVRYDDFKIHLKPAKGGLPEMDFYNVMRDPGEKYGQFYPGLFAVTPLQNYIKDHMIMIRKFPHRQSETMPKGAEIAPHD